ncbi:RIO kinase, partial [Sesbania bispinosa]
MGRSHFPSVAGAPTPMAATTSIPPHSNLSPIATKSSPITFELPPWRQANKIHNHGLKIQKVFKMPLRYLSLEWEGRMNVGMSNYVTTAIRESVREMAIGKTKTTEKADRATVEQAIDPRTRMVLFKMLNRGVFHDINGCISTGKEANVYHATKADGQELAIKVYKTSVLVFKDRDRYVQGDYRFRNGYCRHNPRKMVKTWAEKEMRNLMRLKAAGLRCPTPYLLRLHVLVMEFIGKAGWAAPRLKDAALSLDKLREGYVE